MKTRLVSCNDRFNLFSGAAVEYHLAEKILRIINVDRLFTETFRN